ncbi:MAG: Ribulose-phosphate 3-epimerase [Candidatus Wolfebacteria bacterium GW2011_GWA2_42_10]|uniref:Ribulose-phosphate 3-epimerase n=2 Tax=Candidatus Wolfeibacteriota TaxID=1752735 RepID=A0A0G1AJJ6_9BACT|nr:MAG: Ribulose-phosphate 3-epimerase [Candidatus Wolfebacteria bacterium GW2011_GWB1_41_12]KKS25468.1 MAG: Ribulose-phosphate 3-epimerase [Candidatus Wolfebacteria bacterium GW2011_GWA2_42_10]KKT56645.1 MAG: Ribulose-phosphate 3-epimerase [Candidatus Wolfebacteria bacterium GW2011_GWA1_44_24]
MQIIPAINCGNFECVKEKLEKAVKFSPPADGGVQIDIADGKFTTHKTWNNPEELLAAGGQLSDVNLEIHLMIENPSKTIDNWFKTGAKRIIIHLEAIRKEAKGNPENNEIDIINFILEKCEANGVEFGLAINPETSVEELVPHLDKVKFIQILAVNPGLAGQKFQPQILEKIKFLKNLNFSDYANTIIEVDGGIDLETAKLCKEAGADVLAAASYIWNSQNLKEAFEELSQV